MAKYRTPGVYIEEITKILKSVEPVPTSIPSFVGYTEKASFNGRDQTHRPVLIYSLSGYHTIFGKGHRTAFGLVEDGDEIRPELPGQRFLLYDSIRLFFENGGDMCYVVSVGGYEGKAELTDFIGKARDLWAGGIRSYEASLLVVPDAMLLAKDDCSTLQQEMLRHCGETTKDRFAILDIHDGFKQRSGDSEDVITRFRDGIGEENLSYGAAYYPWLNTSIVGSSEVDFRNIDPSSLDVLISKMKWDIEQLVSEDQLSEEKAGNLLLEVQKLENIESAEKAGVQELHTTLQGISPRYKALMQAIRDHLNLLPPSGAMAGVYCQVDDAEGVWKAPANVSVAAVARPAVSITDHQQEDLNTPLSGKSVNAIREFPGRGVLVWGARTLAGNDNEWRYVSVRRLAIFVEASIKKALLPFVFEPNNRSTWTEIGSMTSWFLQSIWKQGGLMGAKPEDAFSVQIGQGITMTTQDIDQGRLLMRVLLAVVQPAEFVVLEIEQKMLGD